MTTTARLPEFIAADRTFFDIEVRVGDATPTTRFDPGDDGSIEVEAATFVLDLFPGAPRKCSAEHLARLEDLPGFDDAVRKHLTEISYWDRTGGNDWD